MFQEPFVLLSQNLWRTAPAIRSSFLINHNIQNAVRSVSTTITPITNNAVNTPPVELDKLYKRVELEMKGIDPAVLLSYSWFCIAAASHLGIEVTKK